MQGVDVWLNTPRRPLEASGTSGMKAWRTAALNVASSTAGGARGTAPASAGRSAPPRVRRTRTTRTTSRAGSLYDLLEQEIVPLFYERDGSGLPQGWIGRMRASMGGLPPVFNTDRMVHEYLTRYYEPAAADFRRLSAEGFGPTREVAAWVARVQQDWSRVQVVRVDGVTDTVPAGTALDMEADILLGGLSPDEVDVHLAYGLLDGDGVLAAPTLTPLEHAGASDGRHPPLRGARRARRAQRSARLRGSGDPAPPAPADTVPAGPGPLERLDGEETGACPVESVG